MSNYHGLCYPVISRLVQYFVPFIPTLNDGAFRHIPVKNLKEIFTGWASLCYNPSEIP